MVAQQITLNHVGYSIEGEAVLNLWGGGQGTIKMNTIRINKDELTVENILSAINDGEFGCESIDFATVDIYALYGEYGEVKRFLHSFEFDRKDLAQKGTGVKATDNFDKKQRAEEYIKKHNLVTISTGELVL